MTFFPLYAVGCSILGAFFVYASHKNQSWFSRPLTSGYRYLGMVLFAVAFVLWLQVLAVSAAIFACLLTLMLCLICMPFLSILRSTGPNT